MTLDLLFSICKQSSYLLALFICTLYEIIRKVRALSLVNRYVWVRVWKQCCDITRILIGYVLSDACSDWLVENMRAYQEHLF